MVGNSPPRYDERVQGMLTELLTEQRPTVAVEPLLTPASTATTTAITVAYSHEAMVQAIIDNPGATHRQLAGLFGKTAGWFATVLASDSFQAALDPRRGEVCDPSITATLDERLRALSIRSLMVLQDKLDSPAVSDMIVLEAAKIGVKGLGLGQAVPLQIAAPQASGPEAVAARIMEAMDAAKRRSNSAAVDVEVKRG